MRATLEQVDDFREFARRQLTNGGADLTIDELFDRWRQEWETAETIRQVRIGIEQIERGETISIDELKRRHCRQTEPSPDVR
jgi:hypothetical protein